MKLVIYLQSILEVAVLVIEGNECAVATAESDLVAVVVPPVVQTS